MWVMEEVDEGVITRAPANLAMLLASLRRHAGWSALSLPVISSFVLNFDTRLCFW